MILPCLRDEILRVRCRVAPGVILTLALRGRYLTLARQDRRRSAKKLVIGLTGGIASGKSTVSGILRQLGAHIIDADAIARSQMRRGTAVWRSVVEAFGDEVLKSDGEVDRRRLGEMVFRDPAKRRLLDEITHPPVVEEIGRRIRAFPEGIVIVDVPLLVEAGMASMVDRLWVVWVDRETQVGRLMKRDGIGREEAALRLGAQMPLEEKAKMADVVIDNSGSIGDTRLQVERAWRRTLEEYAKGGS